MTSIDSKILTINGGSSSIRFALYNADEPNICEFFGKVGRIGLPGTTLTFNNTKQENSKIPSDKISIVEYLIEWLSERYFFTSIKAIGHRIVHGMKHTQPELVTQELLDELKQISALDPDHLPMEIALIEGFKKRFPLLKQVACFDTAFHSRMPRVAKLLPIPRKFDAAGIQRYGFHGISYSYLMEELTKVAGAEAANGRIVLAHLGNGASLAAVKNGKSMDTTMGFTPAGGLPMGTRSGDLDPGILWYITQKDSLTSEQLNNLINHESGLLGISETSSDVRDLLKAESKDVRAAEAVELFCYQVKKWIGAYSAVLGGLDMLVISGGIGENSAVIRERICQGLEYLGIEIDTQQNDVNAAIISKDKRSVYVRVIPTNEELMIAKMTGKFLN